MRANGRATTTESICETGIEEERGQGEHQLCGDEHDRLGDERPQPRRDRDDEENAAASTSR